jgi:hypothetical protein
MCGWSASAFAIGDTNEVWISATNSQSSYGTTTKNGLGTLASPFYGAFDFILNGLETNTTIHLLPGKFWTRGHYECCDSPTTGTLTNGQRLCGAGMYETTIYLNAVASGTDYDPIYAPPQTFGVEVCDLTVDCAATGSETFKRNGVMLQGSNSAIRRVRVINSIGIFNNNRESYAINIGWSNSTANVVEDCFVEKVFGNYVNGLVILGSAVVRNNTFVMPAITCSGGTYSPSGHFAGINQREVIDSLIDGNTVRNGWVGVYNDTDNLRNVKLTHNVFTNVWAGLYIQNVAAEVDNYQIIGNTFDLNPTSDFNAGCAASGIVIWNRNVNSTPSFRNIHIVNNIVRSVGNVSKKIGSIQLVGDGNNITNVLAHDNIFDPLGYFTFPGCFAVNMYNNFDLAGASVHSRAFLASDTSPLNLDLKDSFVRVNRSSAGTLVLPTAKGYSGKDIVIVNESTSVTLTVSASSGESIFGSSTGTVRIYTSTGQGTWYAH